MSDKRDQAIRRTFDAITALDKRRHELTASQYSILAAVCEELVAQLPEATNEQQERHLRSI